MRNGHKVAVPLWGNSPCLQAGVLGIESVNIGTDRQGKGLRASNKGSKPCGVGVNKAVAIHKRTSWSLTTVETLIDASYTPSPTGHSLGKGRHMELLVKIETGTDYSVKCGLNPIFLLLVQLEMLRIRAIAKTFGFAQGTP